MVLHVEEIDEKPADLAPEDIRRIRVGLGLSQAEAGELLGGGPRAFTKYESGTIKPAASVATLLRVLEANPAVLSTLTGRKVVPIDNGGAKPFEVTGSHISALTDRKFANLTRRLLAAEAHSGGLPMDGIHVAAVITAPDEGEDARIEWKGGPERTAFLPARLCQYQLKATEITPAKAGKDVLTSAGNVQPMIRSALEAGGTYIMMCARSYTKKQIAEREARIRKSLADARLVIKSEQVQFRDADQIAQWINTLPSVAAWVLEQTQPGLIGPFRDWTHWAGRHEHDSSPWITDPRLVPFRDQLRVLVTPTHGVARIVGLSGVGKSRLVLEALAPTDAEEASKSYLSDLVLYAVESEAGSTVVKTAVQNLADAGVRALIVVDRCAAETHQDLAAMVKRSGSRLSLITIDHEIPPDTNLPEDTIFVDRADKTVIEGMLKRIVPNLYDEDHRRLLRFSAGFPQLAVLIADSWVNDEAITSASDDTLIDRIVLGRKPKDAVLLRDAAMLLSTFALIGAKPPIDEDIAEVARLGRNRTADDLRAAFDELQRRGVVQRRGRLVTLQPLPIALALAERQWRQWAPKTWDEVLAGSVPQHLRERAAGQLALLNTTPIATDVVRHVCRFDGPLGSLELLAKSGNSEVLSSLAEIDAEVVVNLIGRLLKPLSGDDLKAVSDDLRRHLAWALEKIAFVSKTFEQGATLLLKLAVAEDQTWRNNATRQFKGLFPVHLADTEAGPEARLRMIDEALESRDTGTIRIVVDALLEGAKTDFFSRSVGAETHGSRRALEPWTPETSKDAWDYVRECLERLAVLATLSDEIGTRAKVGLGHSFRALVSRGQIDLTEQLIATVTKARGRYWPEAFSSLGDVLSYDKDGLEAGGEQRVRKLIETLTPDELADRVRFLVTEMPWDYAGDEKHDFDLMNKRQGDAVHELVEDLLKEPEMLAKFLPQLSRGEQRMSSVFGRALAERSSDPLVWQTPVMAAVESVPEKERNFALLAGYFAALAERHPQSVETFKEQACQSGVFAPALPVVCWSTGICENDIALVCKALDAGLITAFALMQWTFGGVLAKLSPPAVAPLFDKMFGLGGDFYVVALNLMGMYVHGRAARLEELRPQLRLAAIFAGQRSKRGGSQMDAHQFKEMMGWILAKGREDPDAGAIAITLTKQLIANVDNMDQGLIKPLLPGLLSGFPEIVWPLVGQAIVSERKRAWKFEQVLGSGFAFADRLQPPILSLPDDILFAWCHAHPDIGPAFVAVVAPVLTNRNPDAGDTTFHPITKRLLDEFGEREDVLRGLVRNMHTFGWTGSRTRYYALYEPPLRGLENHSIGAVRRWSKQMLSQLSSEINAARDEDDEEQASWGN